ncbi:MAG TPA: hypothetical protein VGM23_00195 [Armatimonadota bacterium]|jgi:hypothetical protein
MRRALLCTLVAVLLATGAFAQPDPNNPQPEARNQPQQRLPAQQNIVQGLMSLAMNQQSTVLLLMPQGLFALRSGVLARVDPKTLDQQKTVELLPPLPPQPEGANMAGEAMVQWLREWAKHSYPAVMLPEGTDLLILIGDQFIRVNATTLETKFNVSIAPQQAQPQDANTRAMELLKPPVLLRDAKSALLYVTRVRQLTALDVNTGQVVSEKPLPETMFLTPLQLMRPGGPGGLNPPGAQGGQNAPPGGAPVGPKPNDPNAAPFADNAPAGAATAQPNGQGDNANTHTYTVVGTMVKHQEGDKTSWTLKTDNGLEAALTGPQATALLQTPNIDGSRVRVTGAFTRNTNTQHPAGTLEVQKYEVLPPQ